MRLKALIIIYLFIWIAYPWDGHAVFIAKREELSHYYGKPHLVMIASTGRSGSTMLTEQIKKFVPGQKVLKTHLLPPDTRFQGKCLFIFSNPDQAAESALYMTLHHKEFAKNHFIHVETADRLWAKRLGGASHQTAQNNLLAYDALGVYQHLKVWLYERVEPTNLENAQILAIKYENLWDDATVEAIKNFLDIPNFQLPPKRPRGHEKLYSKEINFRKMYNLGTEENPRYAAYDDARILWEHAPPFQFLKLLEKH